MVYLVKLFVIKNVYTRYVVNDLIDGNVLDLSMSAEACFDDGGPCVVNISILNNVIVPKSQKTWDKLFSIKGKSNAVWNTEYSYRLVNVIMILEIRNLWILFVIQIFLLLNGWMKNQRQKWKFYQVSCPMNSWRASLWGLTLSLTQYVEPSDPRLMLQAGTMVLSYFL